MTKKRFQEIPIKFIPKNSHQYLLKKNLMNTKCQWLNNYINNQNQQYSQDGWLSKALQIQPIEVMPASEKNYSKKLLKEKGNAFTVLDGNWIEIEKNCGKSYLLLNKQCIKIQKKQRNNLKTQQYNSKNNDYIEYNKNQILRRTSTKCRPRQQKTIESRKKYRNRPLMTQYANFKTKKCFAEKQNYKEQDKRARLKTQTNFRQCLNQSASIRQKIQKQPFSLTPWMLKEDSKIQQDQFTFL